MLFAYSVKLKTGEIFEGMQEATDRLSLARDLRSRGNIPLSITEKEPNITDRLAVFQNIFSKVNTGEQILFTKNLSGMLSAGLPLARALSVLQKQTKNPALNKVLTSVSNDINAGETLSTGLAKFPEIFSQLFVSMVRAGEESGNLAGALSDIGVNMDKSNSLTKRITGALIYPGIIFSAMILIGILMFAFVVPTLAATFKSVGATMPASTQFIIFLGDFFSHNLILSLVGAVAIIAGAFFLFRAKFLEKYIDLLLIKLPVIGNMTKELNTARTARTMSSLLISGVSITRAVEITEDVVQNVYFKEVLQKSRVAIEKGAPFSKTFEDNTSLYPIMMAEMVQVGEETGKLSDMLLQIALFYENEIENRTKNLSTIIEPVLMIFIGAAVGFFAISMISPLYTVLNNIKS